MEEKIVVRDAKPVIWNIYFMMFVIGIDFNNDEWCWLSVIRWNTPPHIHPFICIAAKTSGKLTAFSIKLFHYNSHVAISVRWSVVFFIFFCMQNKVTFKIVCDFFSFSLEHFFFRCLFFFCHTIVWTLKVHSLPKMMSTERSHNWCNSFDDFINIIFRKQWNSFVRSFAGFSTEIACWYSTVDISYCTHSLMQTN